MMSYYIFAGRFQPFHLGHLDVLKQSVLNLEKDDVLVVAVVTKIKGHAIDDKFAKSAAEHHFPDRNPWLPIVALKAISKLVKEMYPLNEILTTVLPSPDTSWTEIKKWYPADRIWIIPDAGEEFDNKKVEFYQKCGERVVRYSDNTGISGKDLRDYYQLGDYESFKKHMPANITDVYWEGENRC